MAVHELMASEPRMMTEDGVATLQENMKVFLMCWRTCGGHFYATRHMAWHLANRVRRDGNPRFHHTYADKSENRAMKGVADSLHGGCTFYKAFWSKVLLE